MDIESERSIENNTVLTDLRQSIDHIDTAFMFVIAERVRLMTKSIALKQQQDLPLAYSDRRKQDLQKTIAIAVEHHVHEAFIRQLFERMQQQALQISQQNLSALQSTPSQQLILGPNSLSIQDLQDSIYHLDVALCCLLAERYHLVQKVGYLKKNLQLPPLASDRWQKILVNKLIMAAALNIDTDFVKDMLELIHQESLRIEQNIIFTN